MSLKNATVEQLHQWALDIIAELAGRASPVSPPVAAPPWESAQTQVQVPTPVPHVLPKAGLYPGRTTTESDMKQAQIELDRLRRFQTT